MLTTRRSHALSTLWLGTGFLLASPSALAQANRHSDAPVSTRTEGQRLPPEAIGPVFTETWAEAEARAARAPQTFHDHRQRNGSQGEWSVSSPRSKVQAHSGEYSVTNRWGDTRMGLGFGRIVDVEGAWIGEYQSTSVSAEAVRAVGFRNGLEVAHTEWFESLGSQPAWFAMDLRGVDRLEIHARPKLEDGGAFWSMDDLAFRPAPIAGDEEPARVVVDFEDAGMGARLTGKPYAGLDWEVGTGVFHDRIQAVHPPLTPPGFEHDDAGETSVGNALAGGGGTSPTLISDFTGPGLNDGAGTSYIPADTCGAIGPNHFVASVNANISVYDRNTGTRVLNQALTTFLGPQVGDPRVAYDVISDRFIVLATDFNALVWVAVSDTNDPTGTWTKSSVVTALLEDAGKWPDYPTLGVNKDFITFGCFMVGGANKMSLFAIDKATFINSGILSRIGLP
jgi:hypothetical protein